jgi:hypothetical protein
MRGSRPSSPYRNRPVHQAYPLRRRGGSCRPMTGSRFTRTPAARSPSANWAIGSFSIAAVVAIIIPNQAKRSDHKDTCPFGGLGAVRVLRRGGPLAKDLPSCLHAVPPSGRYGKSGMRTGSDIESDRGRITFSRSSPAFVHTGRSICMALGENGLRSATHRAGLLIRSSPGATAISGVRGKLALDHSSVPAC